MSIRSSSNLPVESPPNPSTSNLKHRNRRRSKQPFIFEESPIDTMADQRTMAELLRTPTEGYAEAIVVLPILAEQFELKHTLIIMMTSDQFLGLKKDNPHDHIRWFNKITPTIKYKDVPNSAIKLMLFPLSLTRAARRWLEKEPPRSILTWEDLVLKFINEFFPPSRTTNLRNEISNFQQRFDESFHEAWDRYKDLLRACPHHGLPKLIPTRMTLELANRASCTPAGIARDVFILVGNFTFPVNFVIVDYESDPRVPLILGRLFLRTARALIDVHGEEMILHDDKDSSLKDSIDQKNNAHLADIFVDYIPTMFTDEHTLDYSSPSIFDGEKIKEFKLLIDELDLPCDFHPPLEYDLFISQDFSKVDALPSTNNEDKIFNPGILIQEKSVEINTCVVQDKKLAISNASLVFEDFDPPFYEPLFFKEIPKSKMLLLFLSENEEKNYLIKAMKFSKSTNFLRAR
nr:reverse transcriptase domain-containing protein [Tanacetum cinerariifolium]